MNINDEFKGFIRFLKLHGAYKAYMRNIQKFDLVAVINSEPHTYLGRYFLWSSTKEGLNYWIGLQTEWCIEWLNGENPNCYLIDKQLIAAPLLCGDKLTKYLKYNERKRCERKGS